MKKLCNWQIKYYFIKQYLFLFLALLNFSCGNKISNPTTEQSIDNSSRLQVTTTTSTNSKDVALCNKKINSNFTTQVMAYFDINKVYHPEIVRIYFPQMYSDFEKSNYQIVFHKWKSTFNGETFQDPNPLKIRITRIADHAELTTFSMNALQWNTVKSELEKNSNTTYTMQDAFLKLGFDIDLKDLNADFDVLKLSLYKDGKWVEDTNMLIPAFYTDPNTYAIDHNQVLVNLHPLFGSTNTTLGKDIFASFCF